MTEQHVFTHVNDGSDSSDHHEWYFDGIKVHRQGYVFNGFDVDAIERKINRQNASLRAALTKVLGTLGVSVDYREVSHDDNYEAEARALEATLGVENAEGNADKLTIISTKSGCRGWMEAYYNGERIASDHVDNVLEEAFLIVMEKRGVTVHRGVDPIEFEANPDMYKGNDVSWVNKLGDLNNGRRIGE